MARALIKNKPYTTHKGLMAYCIYTEDGVRKTIQKLDRDLSQTEKDIITDVKT